MTQPADDDPELIDVRPDERFDAARLDRWLRTHLDGVDATVPLVVRQFGGGHANLTYLLRLGDREFVLRRPPLGPVAPTSHDMRREHRVLARLVDAFPLAPRSYALCQDQSILGCDFHIMERRHGFVVRRDLPPAFRDQPELNRRLSETIVDTLAALHGVDPESVGLGDLGRPEGFLERQLTGWVSRWQAARHAEAGDDDRVDRLAAWLQRDVPSSRYATLLHHDYKLDNMLVETADPATPVAVLDWDMATRGDPLVELGYLLIFWAEATDDPAWIDAAAMPTHYSGGLTRDAVVARYADRTGFDVTRVRWYHVFGLFKLIVILRQIYVRYVRGQTQDQRFARFGRRIDSLIAKAWFVLSSGH